MKDKIIEELINAEQRRQDNCIELIASENIVSQDVLDAMGSILTNKYAEGTPGHRFYNGCQYIDKIEQLACDRFRELFNTDYHVNVQPHSGAQANMAVFEALLNVGDTVLSMDLSNGGHLSHGSPVNYSGKHFNVVQYGINENGEIDYDEVQKLAEQHRPKLIICGASNYSKIIDFERFAEIRDSIADVDMLHDRQDEHYLLADIAHIAGLVAGGVHPSPFGYADVVTTTTHKSLRGPRGGVIACKQELAKKIDSAVFPGIQGGPLEHVIAGKAVCFYEAMQPEFSIYAEQIVKNAKALANTLKVQGIKIVSDGTENHVFTIDLTGTELTGKELANQLDEIGITANKNTVPNDTRSPFVTSGVRIGTPAVTTRGFTTDDMIKVGCIISDLIKGIGTKEQLQARVKELCLKHPLPYKDKAKV